MPFQQRKRRHLPGSPFHFSCAFDADDEFIFRNQTSGNVRCDAADTAFAVTGIFAIQIAMRVIIGAVEIQNETFDACGLDF